MRNQIEKEKGVDLDIHIGKATICFDPVKLVWIKPGGEMIFTEKRARQYCQQMADLMDQKKCA